MGEESESERCDRKRQVALDHSSLFRHLNKKKNDKRIIAFH